MRWLFWMIRSSFCKHEWTYDEVHYEYEGFREKKGMKVSATCEKCGWHRSYWKH